MITSKVLLQKVVKMEVLGLPPLAGLSGVAIETLLNSCHCEEVKKKRRRREG